MTALSYCSCKLGASELIKGEENSLYWFQLYFIKAFGITKNK